MSAIQDAVVSAMTGLFSHGPTPLQNTMAYEGDPGLLGPDSVSWRVIGDSAVFVGGIRALVVQATHAEVVAGVEDHSTYRADPLGRLSRTGTVVGSQRRPVAANSEKELMISQSHDNDASYPIL